MEAFQKPIDLDLWQDSDLIHRQNLLKDQFMAILEKVGNSFSPEELKLLSPNSRGVKISKGNDLLGFPYQVLDVIRDFDQTEGINIRLLNWIGNGFYLTLLLGKNKAVDLESLLESGFLFGMSENQWDYPDLILSANTTREKEKITGSKLGFSHWIKRVEVDSDPNILMKGLIAEVKKILGILRLPKE